MRGHAHIVPRQNGFMLRSPTNRPDGEASYFFFYDMEGARDFCACCNFSWSVSVPPFELKPPRGSA